MEPTGMSSDMSGELFSFGNHLAAGENANTEYDSNDARCTSLYEGSSDLEQRRTSTVDEMKNGDFLEPNESTSIKKQKTDGFDFCYSQDSLDHSKLESFDNDELEGDVSQSTKVGENLLHAQISADVRFGSTEAIHEQSITELLKELSQESKMLCIQWVQLFDDSEKFENFCPTRLDRILQEAKQLEENLSRQKDMLCHRLKGLSKTLQMM